MNDRFLMRRPVIFQFNCRFFRDRKNLNSVYHVNIPITFINKWTVYSPLSVKNSNFILFRRILLFVSPYSQITKQEISLRSWAQLQLLLLIYCKTFHHLFLVLFRRCQHLVILLFQSRWIFHDADLFFATKRIILYPFLILIFYWNAVSDVGFVLVVHFDKEKLFLEVRSSYLDLFMSVSLT